MWVVMVQELLEAGDGLITRVRPVNILLLQLVPIAPVADRVNTKLEQYVVAVVVVIHKRVRRVQTVGHRILARRVNI